MSAEREGVAAFTARILAVVVGVGLGSWIALSAPLGVALLVVAAGLAAAWWLRP